MSEKTLFASFDLNNPALNTPEKQYDMLISPFLAELAETTKTLGMSVLCLVDYGEANALETGVTLQMQDIISPMLSMAILAVRSGGNFDTLVALLRQVGPAHNSVALSLLGFPPEGGRVPDDHQYQVDQLKLAWQLASTHGLRYAQEVLFDALTRIDPTTKPSA